MNTAERLELLSQQAGFIKDWLGDFDYTTLENWLECELGSSYALDHFVSHGPLKRKALVTSPLLHIISGNTPHAAFQSVFKALLLGAHSLVKLPSEGIPEFEQWHSQLPACFKEKIEIAFTLPEEWHKRAQLAIIYGGSQAIEHFRNSLPRSLPRIEHGPKISIALCLDIPNSGETAALAEDILRFEQQGCLSVHAIYLRASHEAILQFGEVLAEKLQAFRDKNHRETPTVSASGTISNARELTRFRVANHDSSALWESKSNTAWTIHFEKNTALQSGIGHGWVNLHQVPSEHFPQCLGAEIDHLSTVALLPYDSTSIQIAESLRPSRICRLGQTQNPHLLWDPDGHSSLSSLVKWRNLD